MALLDVDEIETGLMREPGGLDVSVLKPVELGVGDQGRIGPGGRAGGLVEDRPRVEQRVVLSQDRSLERIAARVSQLQPDEQVVVAAVGLDVGRSCLTDQPLESRGVGRIDDEAGAGWPGLRGRRRRPRPR